MKWHTNRGSSVGPPRTGKQSQLQMYESPAQNGWTNRDTNAPTVDMCGNCENSINREKLRTEKHKLKLFLLSWVMTQRNSLLSGHHKVFLTFSCCHFGFHLTIQNHNTCQWHVQHRCRPTPPQLVWLRGKAREMLLTPHMTCATTTAIYTLSLMQMRTSLLKHLVVLVICKFQRCLHMLEFSCIRFSWADTRAGCL